MTGNRNTTKVAREEATWKRTPNQRLKRSKMGERRDKTVQKEKDAAEGRHFERDRVKIQIESSEEMEYRQEEELRGKRFETGQSSRGSKQVREGGGRKQQEQRGRGRPRQATNNAEGNRTQKRRKRRNRSISRAVHEAEQAYNLDSNANIRNIIDAMEEKVLEEPSDPEMDEWSLQLPDPGHTRGRLTLYRRALHTYWVLKHLLAKAMEQVATEMVEMTQETAAAKKEVANVEELVRQQNEHLKEIKAMLTELRKDSVSNKIDRGNAAN